MSWPHPKLRHRQIEHQCREATCGGAVALAIYWALTRRENANVSGFAEVLLGMYHGKQSGPRGSTVWSAHW
jgi:hypothetical protein